MSGYSDDRAAQTASTSQPSQPQQYQADQSQVARAKASPERGTIPPPSDRPRQSFSTFSIREPGKAGYDPRAGVVPLSVARSTPPPGPNAPPPQASYVPRAANGHDTPPTRPYDPYATPNQYSGPAPSGPSSTVPPPSSSGYPSRTEYIRSHSGSVGQQNVGGGLGLGGRLPSGGDPRFTRNGVHVEVPGRRSGTSSPDKTSNIDLPQPPRGPSAASVEASASRAEQLREIPTGPRPRTPLAPRSDIGSPKPIPTAPSSQSHLIPTGPSSAETKKPSAAEDDPSELSSLAKLRQFKASIATTRSKQLHDVDSDALAEMAASFLASTASEIEARAAIPTQPSADTKPVDANKSREQELKERLKLKALKPESSSSSLPSDIPTAPSASQTDRNPTLDASGNPLKHRLEDGEAAEGEKRKRIELMPTTASTTDSRSAEDAQLTGSTDSNDATPLAGKRARAQEWMKTTGAASQDGQAATGESSAKIEEKKAKVEPAPAPREERSLQSRVERDSSRKERQPSPDRGRGGKTTSARTPKARSRSPVKEPQWKPAGGPNDPSYLRNRQAEEKRLKEEGRSADRPEKLSDRLSERDRDVKPSLAERIGPSFNKDRRIIDPEILDAPLGARDRRDSMRSATRPNYDQPPHDIRRRSRSPQRTPASRAYDDRNDPRSSISGRDRPDYRARDRELSPYSLARQRSPNRELFRDDRRYDDRDRDRDNRPGYTRPSPGGYPDAPPSARAAPTPPATSTRPPAAAPAPAPTPTPAPAAADPVAETLALLKAQIARLESQIPGGPPAASAPAAAAASAPAPAPAAVQPPQSRYPEAKSHPAPPSSTYPPETRSNYASEGRFDRDRASIYRPTSPQPRLSPPSLPPIGYERERERVRERERPRALTPSPLPLHAHDAPPSRYQDALPPRYSDPRDAPRPDYRDDYRAPPRGYDTPPSNPPHSRGYDSGPRDFPPPSLGGPPGPAYGGPGGNYRPAPRDFSPPPPARGYGYDSREPLAPQPRTEYRERYDPAARSGPPPARYGSPVPSSYGGGAYDSRSREYDQGYPGPSPRRQGGFDSRAASAGPGRGGVIVTPRRGVYEGSLGGRSDAGDRDRDRDRDMRDSRDFDRGRDYRDDRDMRDRDMRDSRVGYDDRGDFGGRGGYGSRGVRGRGG